MISSFLKRAKASFSYGAITLIFAIILLMLSTLIIIFAANFTRTNSQAAANLNRQSQAFYAAEAGIDYGDVYLQQNYEVIIAAPVSGLINYTNASLTDVTQPNNSKFSVTFTNPTANNFNTILITSTGVSDDNSSTVVQKQLVQKGALLVDYGTNALVSKGSVNMSGNATVANNITNQTIRSASTVSFSGSAQTIVTGIGSNSAATGSDVQQNQTGLADQSQNDFFATYFGATASNVQGQFANYYNNSGNTDYSSTLSGMNGTSIWIDQTGGSTASISGNTVIGTAANPVLMVINGSLSITGNVTVYGFIFVIGTSGITTLSGNINITGGLATSDDLNMSGNSGLTFNNVVLENLRNNPNMRYFAKIPGGWNDF